LGVVAISLTLARRPHDPSAHNPGARRRPAAGRRPAGASRPGAEVHASGRPPGPGSAMGCGPSDAAPLSAEDAFVATHLRSVRGSGPGPVGEAGDGSGAHPPRSAPRCRDGGSPVRLHGTSSL